jgi:putative ABC transport system permease protein
VPLPLPRYRDAIARREFSDRVLDRLRRLPSIESVTHSQSGLTAIVMTIALPAQLTAGGRRSDEESFGVSFVGADHFRTFGIPIVAGTDCPPPAVERRAVLSESFARLMFPAQSPVGQTIDIAGAGRHTIVGVAGNVRALRTNTSGMPQVYVCAGAANAPARGVIAIRARNGVDPLALAPALRDAVRAADPMQPVVEVKTVPQFVGEAVVTRWFEGGLIVSLAAIAVVLATFGLYAVVAYLVAQRTHEIGVRMALGARRADVLGLVLREGGTITALGLALGVLAALPLVRLVRSMLFDVQPLDVATFAAGVILLSAVALAATCVPALRASRVDPLIALRAE